MLEQNDVPAYLKQNKISLPQQLVFISEGQEEVKKYNDI